MDKPKWTQGPRRVDPAPSFAHSPRVFGGPDGKTLIAEFGNMEGDTERHHADAVLDAAAPDLAKAAEPIVAWSDEVIEIEGNWFVQNGKTKVTVEHFRALAAAYRKALGET